MATRPVFEKKKDYPYYSTINVNFEWSAGFAPIQKQRSINSLHTAYSLARPDKPVLEASTKSTDPLGVALSAFNLKKYVPSLGGSIPVENVFQAGKVFSGGGPYLDLLNVSPKEAKTDNRIKTSGRVVGFSYEGVSYPSGPKTIFYDWIYVNALLENEELLEKMSNYSAFTDIEFNPDSSVNCQAKACAIAVSLRELGLIEKAKDFEEFKRLMTPPSSTVPVQNKGEEKPAIPDISIGATIVHRKFGEGEIVAKDEKNMTVRFENVGDKILNIAITFEGGIVKLK